MKKQSNFSHSQVWAKRKQKQKALNCTKANLAVLKCLKTTVLALKISPGSKRSDLMCRARYRVTHRSWLTAWDNAVILWSVVWGFASERRITRATVTSNTRPPHPHLKSSSDPPNLQNSALEAIRAGRYGLKFISQYIYSFTRQRYA